MWLKGELLTDYLCVRLCGLVREENRRAAESCLAGLTITAMPLVSVFVNIESNFTYYSLDFDQIVADRYILDLCLIGMSQMGKCEWWFFFLSLVVVQCSVVVDEDVVADVDGRESKSTEQGIIKVYKGSKAARRK
jgi:hypothetical protein